MKWKLLCSNAWELERGRSFFAETDGNDCTITNHPWARKKICTNKDTMQAQNGLLMDTENKVLEC